LQKNENRPGYKKTKVGWLPDDWKCVPFTDIFDRVVMPLSPIVTQTYREIGVRSHGKGVFHKEPVTGADLGSKRVFHCQPCALVFNIVFAWEQAVAVLSDNERGFIASHRFPMYKGKNGQAFEPFFLSFFKTRRGKDGLSIASPGGAGRNKTLGQREMDYLYVPKPSGPEQETIAEVLECWDKAIRGYERKIEKKRNIKMGLMQRLLSGKQRLPGFDGEWKEVRLGECGRFLKGKGISKDDVVQAGLPCIRYGQIYTTNDHVVKDLPSCISSEHARQSTRIRYNDLLLAGSGETIDEIGKALAYMDTPEAYAGGDIVVLRPNSASLRADYLAYYLNTEGRRAVRRLGQGQSVVHVYGRDLMDVKLPLPSEAEQKAIADVLSSGDAEIAAMEHKQDAIREQKRFLLNNMVTGTIRLPQFTTTDAAEVATGDTR